MSATRDLIAAARTAADDLRKPWSPLFIHEQAEELRELCARAMAQPDIAEVERLVSALTAGAHDSMTLGDYTDEEAARSALLDYVRDHFRDAAKMVQPVGEVPMQCGWYQDGDEESTTWQTSCGGYFTLNDGTPSDNHFLFCHSCGKPVVEYPIEDDIETLRGEVKP